MSTDRPSCPCEVCQGKRKGIISRATGLPKRPRIKYPLVDKRDPAVVRVVEGERAEVNDVERIRDEALRPAQP